MPNDAKSKETWITDLRKFANGTPFIRGQTPRPLTWAGAEVKKTKKCALSSGITTSRNMEPRRCVCWYHSTPTKKLPTASTSATGNKHVLSDSKLSLNSRDCLPKGWLATIDPIDQEWIGKSLFTHEKKTRQVA